MLPEGTKAKANLKSNPLLALLQTPKKVAGDESKSGNFLELLKRIGEQKQLALKDPKLLKKVLPNETKQQLGDESKTAPTQKGDLLASLMQKVGKDVLKTPIIKATQDAKTSEIIEPKIASKAEFKELKALISVAKDLIKDKLLSSDEYINKKAKDLPNNLKSLVKVAKDLGLDLQKITLESVAEFEQTNQQEKPRFATLSSKNFLEAKADTKIAQNTLVPQKTEQKSDLTSMIALVKDTKDAKNSEEMPKIERILKEDDPKVVDLKTKEAKDKDLPKVAKSEEQKTLDPKAQELKTSHLNPEEPKSTLADHKEAKTYSSEYTNSTEETKTLEQTPAQRVEPTLSSLLRGSEATQTKDDSMQADGVANIKSTNSLDVKIKEAKTMIKYLSEDIKKSIEEYRPPFMRIKLQLNPKNLGEMDLTVVQRGSSMHITLSSNNAAINMLSLNQADLRAQLQHSGIQNASLNFSSSDQHSDHAGSSAHQQEQRERQHAAREYKYASKGESDLGEASEEILSSLEIVIPKYI
ncbi:MAG: flagellar hook-length control protein FliK [Sulfuricurvum sp.]